MVVKLIWVGVPLFDKVFDEVEVSMDGGIDQQCVAFIVLIGDIAPLFKEILYRGFMAYLDPC